MKKSDLVAKVSEDAGITKAQASSAIETIITSLVEVGSEGGSLNLQGLGSFKGKTRPARKGRNPATGEMVDIPEKKVLAFKMSAGLTL